MWPWAPSTASDLLLFMNYRHLLAAHGETGVAGGLGGGRLSGGGCISGPARQALVWDTALPRERGKMWAIEHWGVEPDLMTMAKAIASGLPLSAVVARDELMKDVYPGSLGGTYGGNPIACATALKVLEIIEREKIVEKAAELGKKLEKRLGEFEEKFEVIGDVRGKGPMLAMELVKDRKTKKPNPRGGVKGDEGLPLVGAHSPEGGPLQQRRQAASAPHNRRRAPGEGIGHPG